MTVTPASLWYLRGAATQLHTNAALAAATDRNLLNASTGRNLYLCGFMVRPLTACLITIKNSAGNPIMEIDLAINEDYLWNCGFFPIKDGIAGAAMLISHNGGAPITIVQTAWGLIGD